MDHLKGTVFVDHLSQLKQVRVKNKMKKRHREAERG
jgi:peptide deformylase